jgi:hypothetical protein
MSAQALTTAAPTWARRVWADATHIFLEIPCKDGPPFIQKYSKSEGGLSKALDLICLAFRQESPRGGSYPLLKHPRTQKPGINNFSQEQRDRASAVLKRLKIT